jgi:hypothetical protein
MRNFTAVILQHPVRTLPNQSSEKGNEMLLQAIQDQSPGLVQAALESRADVNSRDNHGRTPLMHAAKLGNLAIVQMLLAAGANVWDRDSDGKLPLIYTETGDHVEAARAIGSAMRAEADPQWMHEALAQFADGDYALVAGLFAAGADGSGFPFIVAIQSGEVPIVKEFLKASVNVNVTVHTWGGRNCGILTPCQRPWKKPSILSNSCRQKMPR